MFFIIADSQMYYKAGEERKSGESKLGIGKNFHKILKNRCKIERNMLKCTYQFIDNGGRSDYETRRD